MTRVILCAAVLFGAILPMTLARSTADAQQPASKADAKNGAAKREIKGRLPAHYGKLVDEEQKERIYQIQANYSQRIDALEAQLKALTTQRDSEVRAVLTAQQQSQLDALLTEAKNAKKAAKGAAKKGIDPTASKLPAKSVK